MAEVENFMNLDIRVGKIAEVEFFAQANKAAYKLWIDFGAEIGTKKSSAQITDLYTEEELRGKQILGVVNFPSKQIADFMSEVLVLGVYAKEGVVLITPDKEVEIGDELG